MTFDPQAATRAMIDGLGPEALAKAEAYTTGNHWLMLWGLVVTAIVTAIIIRLRVLDRIEARLASRSRAVRHFAIFVVFFLLSALLALPWTLYSDWWREDAYGRSSQSLADYLGQGAIGIVISTLLGALFFLGVYALIRRTGSRWWLWSGGLTAASLAVFLLLAPTLIEPLFNKYQPVPEGPVKAALAIEAQKAGIAADRIFLFDGSRQSNNFTANVSGLGPAARIAISDVAMKQASLDEVKAVTGHEIGHYVLHHVWWMVGIGAASLPNRRAGSRCCYLSSRCWCCSPSRWSTCWCAPTKPPRINTRSKPSTCPMRWPPRWSRPQSTATRDPARSKRRCSILTPRSSGGCCVR